MKIFPERWPDYRYGSPDIVQQDGGAVNERAAPFIYGGVPVEANDFLYLTLQSRVKNRSDQKVLNAILIVAVVLMTGILNIFADGERNKMYLGGAILVIAAAVLYYYGRAFSKRVSRAVEDRQVRFYSYTFYDKVYYKYDSDDYKPTCYADLGGFAVKISDETRYSQNVTGAVVTVDDKDYFYLLL
ncbi:MAG: hypothetical protein ACI4JF_04995 [Oscillospiraceae bacterium]